MLMKMVMEILIHHHPIEVEDMMEKIEDIHQSLENL